MIQSFLKYSTFIALIVLGNIFFSFNKLEALSCAEDDRTTLIQLQASDAVFIGTILTNTKPATSAAGSRYELAYETKVNDAVKGVSKDAEILVYVDKTWGSTKLEVGQKYLMLLAKHDGRLIQPLCETSIIEANSERAAPYIADFEKVRQLTLPGKKQETSDNRIEQLLLVGAAAVGFGFTAGYMFKGRKVKRSAR